ncbi:hypothetical protein [Nocardioides humi]|uniref:Uncharacterized protein n=1 Tax=Nocardioides humi TaxID=449461 RepID=A0ABN2AS04_9ACTN|nr:hypothetical protein [Nocardioides humi]
MSPWSEDRGPKWPLFVGFGCLLVGLVGGFLLMTGVVDRTSDEPDRPAAGRTTTPAGPDDTPSADPADPSEPRLGVVSWGMAAGQLAVVVRNDSDRVIDRARVAITARDRSGVALLTTSGTPKDVCCTIVGLAPGQEFGLFAQLRSELRDVADVEVRPVSADLGETGDAPRIDVGRPKLHRETDDTVVTVRLTAHGELTGYVAAQAVLVDENGAVAQVVSGRFYCFAPGEPRRIRLRLFHPVPAQLQLERVLAQAIPDGVPPGVPGRC